MRSYGIRLSLTISLSIIISRLIPVVKFKIQFFKIHVNDEKSTLKFQTLYAELKRVV